MYSFFLLPLYSGDEVWEGIWNQIHLVVMDFGLERLHHVTIWHAQTIGVSDMPRCLEHTERSTSVSEKFQKSFKTTNHSEFLDINMMK